MWTCAVVSAYDTVDASLSRNPVANYPIQVYMFIKLRKSHKEIDRFLCYYTGIVMCNNKYVTAVNFSQIQANEGVFDSRLIMNSQLNSSCLFNNNDLHYRNYVLNHDT